MKLAELNSYMALGFAYFLVLCFYATLAFPLETRFTYYGYSLLRVTPVNDEQLQYLLKINANSSIGIDFWLRTTAVNHSADVMVSPSASEFFIPRLKERKIPYEVMIKDIGKLIQDDLIAPSSEVENEFFSEYRSYDEMLQFLSLLIANNPAYVTPEVIGMSYEKRPLLLLKISKPNEKQKPAIWMQGGAHAREHIGPATVIYITYKLLTSCLQTSDVAALVEAFDWYILPVLNPDGYEYALTTDRLWRKTRSFNPEYPDCIGVDANRNWDFHWSGASGASQDPCSHNYAGSSAFSEPETRAVADYMLRKLKGSLLLFLDIHSYSQRWLTPWGYTTRLPDNYEDQKTLAEVATSALAGVYGTKYSVGSSAGILYTVTGGARDWVHGVVGAAYSYVVELRDKGDYGFVLPKEQIQPTAIETWTGVKAMAAELARRCKGRSKDVPSNQTLTGFAYGIAVFWWF